MLSRFVVEPVEDARSLVREFHENFPSFVDQQRYLIATDGGRETNISNDCGRTPFDENLLTQARLHRSREELLAL